jgi:hypothetical protein
MPPGKVEDGGRAVGAIKSEISVEPEIFHLRSDVI